MRTDHVLEDRRERADALAAQTETQRLATLGSVKAHELEESLPHYHFARPIANLMRQMSTALLDLERRIPDDGKPSNTMGRCKHCGAEFERAPTGRRREFCGEKCRQTWHRHYGKPRDNASSNATVP